MTTTVGDAGRRPPLEQARDVQGLELSVSTMDRIWRAFSARAAPQRTFELSTELLFVDKVRDIVGLYLSSPDQATVLDVVMERTAPPTSPCGCRTAAIHAKNHRLGNRRPIGPWPPPTVSAP